MTKLEELRQAIEEAADAQFKAERLINRARGLLYLAAKNDEIDREAEAQLYDSLETAFYNEDKTGKTLCDIQSILEDLEG